MPATITTPDASRHNDSPAYLRQLIESTRLSQAEVAQVIGVDARTLRRHLLGETRISYPVQFAVECLAASITAARRPARALRSVPSRQLARDLAGLLVERDTAPPASYAWQRADDQMQAIRRELQRRAA
jgi:transcriptional regulator with XRE-family HTH domain